MNLSSIMARQVAELQHTVSLSLMKTQMATQAAQAVVMLFLDILFRWIPFEVVKEHKHHGYGEDRIDRDE